MDVSSADYFDAVTMSPDGGAQAVDALRWLTVDWQDFGEGVSTRQASTVILTLCRDGLTECKIHGRAWATQTAVRFVAIVSGPWREGNRLQSVLRQCVPAWGNNKVVAIFDRVYVYQVRLTSIGADARSEFLEFRDPSLLRISGPPAVRIDVLSIDDDGAAPGAEKVDTDATTTENSPEAPQSSKSTDEDTSQDYDKDMGDKAREWLEEFIKKNDRGSKAYEILKESVGLPVTTSEEFKSAKKVFTLRALGKEFAGDYKEATKHEKYRKALERTSKWQNEIKYLHDGVVPPTPAANKSLAKNATSHWD